MLRLDPPWLGLVAALAASCAAVPPPESKTDPDVQALLGDPDEIERTAEWLFVTSEASRSLHGATECAQVAFWLRGEASCVGELCVHARDLGREWLERCIKEKPDLVATVHDWANKFEERTDLAPNACTLEGARLVRTQECGEPAACELQAQRWISRCGERYATPLIVLMLTRTLQRRFPEDLNRKHHRVAFDTRSCERLGEWVFKHVGCDGEQACAAGTLAADAYMDRCAQASAPVPLKLAFAIADVRVGAGLGVDPIPADPLQRSLAVGDFPLQLEDNKGIVSWVCGMRPNTVADYLEVRRGCAPGELIVVRLDDKQRVRTVAIPHDDDTTFTKQLPFMAVHEEREARSLAGLEQFRLQLAEAVEESSGQFPERGVAKLTEAILSRAWDVVHQKAYQAILRDADASLEATCTAWGRAKAKQANRLRRPQEVALFVGRTLRNPLHDMREDGSVELDSYAAPWGLTLERWMPTCVDAYREEVVRLEAGARRKRPDKAGMARLRDRVVALIRDCSRHEKAAQQGLDAATACMLDGHGCTQSKLRKAVAPVDPSRLAAAQARNSIQLILASGVLDRDEVDRLEAERVASGCLDP